MYLADACNSAKAAIWWSIYEGSRISVNSKETGEIGIGDHLRWVRPVLNIALSESMNSAPFCTMCLPLCHVSRLIFASTLYSMMLSSSKVRAERAPKDPKYPRMRLVGVFPVRDGWAHVSPEAIAGKGQDYRSPLYVAPREGLLRNSSSCINSSTACQGRLV